MRILIAGHNADLYGASRSLLRLASRLARDGNQVVVALPEDGPLKEALKNAGAGVRVLSDLVVVERKSFATWGGRLRMGLAVLRSRKSFLRLICEVKPDVVHTNSSVILATGWAARAAGVSHVQHVREFYTEFGRLWPVYRWWLQRNAERVVCVSEAVASQFMNRGAVVVLHNGFPRDEFPAVEPERARAFRARFNIPADAPLAGVIGRIKLKRKGQETFVRAAALVHAKFPDARFALIGSPFAGNESHEAELRAMAAANVVGDRVIFCGETNEVADAYAALDVVVLSSGNPEPFGGVVIEAMAHARAVVGTNIGGTPEQIADGETGLLVPPDDPRAMAAALEKLFANTKLRADMGAAGRRRFLERFEFEPFYAQMSALLRDVVKRR